MNNHWETNYKPDQEGEITFRYALRPYTGGYDPAAAQRFGRDICQALLAVPADPTEKPGQPLLSLDADDADDAVVATQVRPSRDGKAWMVRLFNTGTQPATARLAWNHPVGPTSLSNPMEDPLDPAPAELNLVGQEFITLRVERP